MLTYVYNVAALLTVMCHNVLAVRVAVIGEISPVMYRYSVRTV